MQIPVVDFKSSRESLAAQIGSAARSVGFFYVANHGLEELVETVFTMSARLFTTPAGRAALSTATINKDNRGFVAVGAEKLDGKNADPKEAFNIGDEATAEEIAKGLLPFRGSNVWPKEDDPALSGFRALMQSYFSACHKLAMELMRAIAVDLKIPDPNFFDDKVDRPMAILRMLFYPVTKNAAASGDASTTEQATPRIVAGQHTDYGCITILATRPGDESLQVLPRGTDTWVTAPHIPGTFICNIGDLLMRWSNNVYVSTPHRVIDRHSATASSNAAGRFSMPFFLDPNPDAIISVVSSCVSDDRPIAYPKAVTGAEYLTMRLNASYDFRQDETK